MRKYSLANISRRGSVDLREFEDVIINAVQEFAPGNTVVVASDYYMVRNPLTQSQAVKIGRRICESDLSRHCIKLSKLFNSKEVSDGNNKKQEHNGWHH